MGSSPVTTKNAFEKDLFRLMNKSVLGKPMENLSKHSDIKLVTTTKKKKLFGVKTNLSYLEFFHRKFIRYRNEKISNTH